MPTNPFTSLFSKILTLLQNCHTFSIYFSNNGQIKFFITILSMSCGFGGFGQFSLWFPLHSCKDKRIWSQWRRRRILIHIPPFLAKMRKESWRGSVQGVLLFHGSRHTCTCILLPQHHGWSQICKSEQKVTKILEGWRLIWKLAPCLKCLLSKNETVCLVNCRFD